MKTRMVLVLISYGLSTGLLIWNGMGCGGEQLDQQAWIERGQAALKPFKTELKSALMEAMESGPEQAIEVCSVVAPDLADEMSTNLFRIGRTSHRLRNNRNAPQSWLNPILAEFIDNPGNTDPRVVRLPGGKVGYAEPIFIVPMCLTCHGQDLPPQLADRIKETYPEDQARDFKDGDFRGLFWVEFEPTEDQSI